MPRVTRQIFIKGPVSKLHPSKADPKNLDWEGEFRNGNGGPSPSGVYCWITEVSVVSTFTVAEGEILWGGKGKGAHCSVGVVYWMMESSGST